MTKQQANAMMTALEAQKINASAAMRFDQAGTESWSVILDASQTYTGAQLAQLTTYCQQQGLNLTVIVSEMGVT